MELARRRRGARPELWIPHYDPAREQRTYASLHRDADIDVWAIFWLPENDTGWHDHDISSGAVHVISGALEEHALIARRPGPPPHRIARARRSRSARRTSTA